MRYCLTLIGLLFLLATPKAQYKTDLRVIDESARYSRDKKFKTWTLTAGYGPAIPFTDLTPYTLFPSNHLDFGFNASIAKQIYPSFALDLQFVTANMYGQKQQVYFDGNLMDFTLNLQAYINQMVDFPGPIKDRWNFYLKIGLGMQTFRSQLRYVANDEFVRVSDFTGQTEDMRYVVLGYDKLNPEKKIARKAEMILPLGAGALYRINNSFDIGIESTIRFSFEDNMDNILIGATNDRYWYTAINLSYNIGRKNIRHSKWTYRTYGFNIFGKPKKDPILSEIEDLELKIKSFEANRPIKRDSVFIVHTLKKVYGRNNLHQIFFTSNNTVVDKTYHEELAQVALKLMENEKWQVEIIGFSDEREETANNMAISEARCNQVADKLIHDLGIDSQRIIITPKGNNELLSPTKELTPRGLHFINRRVDMVIRK